VRRFDAITFDCYGTLIDWASGIAAALGDAVGEPARRFLSAQLFAAYLRAEQQLERGPYRPYHEILLAAATEAAATLGCTAIAPERVPASLPRWRPFSDTNPALLRLRQSGYVLGILSNVDDNLLAATQRHFSISFDFAVTAERVRSYKPSPAHFLVARETLLRRFGARRWLHVAQSHYHDLAPACTLSIPVVWVNREGAAPPPGAPAPLRQVADLLELAAWLTDPEKSVRGSPDCSASDPHAVGRERASAARGRGTT